MSAFPTIGDLTEKEWTRQVVDLARMLGWSRYHTFRSDRSPAGWPDEALVRERLILLELKTEKGKLTDAQKGWLGKLSRAGVEVYVARPGMLAELGIVLATRRYPGLDWPRGERGDQARAAASVLRAEVPVPAD